jgi:hypothetical protein
MSAENAQSCLNANSQQVNSQSSTQQHAQEPLTEAQRQDKIRQLNDRLRKTGNGGQVLITQGVIDRGLDFAKEALMAVSHFNAFTTENDPWQEHDCAVVSVLDQQVIFKIDYFDLTMTSLSGHGHDPKRTKSVMTIMLAAEY